MSKGLEELKRIAYEIACHNCQYYKDNQCTIEFECVWKTIEKELEQAEEDRKVLDTFKNALTVEHHEYPTTEHNDSEDIVSYVVKELYTIKQNELEKDMRKALREWVFKNAFPKELKALEFLKDTCNLKVYKNKFGQCFLEGTNILFPISKEEYNLFRKAFNYGGEN